MDGGKTHTYSFKIVSYFTDLNPGNNEKSDQFTVAGLSSAKIVAVDAPNSTIVGTTLDIDIIVDWSTTFGADLKVILYYSNGSEIQEKPITGASTGDRITFTVTAPSTPKLWHFGAEVWTRAIDSTEWRHDSTGWGTNFTINVIEQFFSAKVIGVGDPGTVRLGSTFDLTAFIKYEFSEPMKIIVKVDKQSLEETLSGKGVKNFTFNIPAPSNEGTMDLKVEVEYYKDGSWQQDEQSYKTLSMKVQKERAVGPLPEFWYENVEKPFKELIIDPIMDLFS